MEDTIEKDLIHLDERMPPLRNNTKFTNAIKEFITNRNIPLLYVHSEYSFIQKTAYEIMRKSANFSVTSYDASLVTNAIDILR